MKLRNPFSNKEVEVLRKENLMLVDRVTALGNENMELLDKIAELHELVGDPKEVVKKLTDDKFKFFDYHKLDEGKKKNYFSQVQMILESDAFHNICQMLNKEFLEWAAKQSRNYEGVIAMRHQISGIELLQQTMEEVVNPSKPKEEVKDPYAGI